MPYKTKLYVTLLTLALLVGRSARAQHWYAPEGYLSAIASRLAQGTQLPIRILHLGDSHLSGGYTTAPIAEALRAQYGASVSVDRIGVPGATFATFAQDRYMKQIRDKAPDLIIVSLGTNDSYTYSFSRDTMHDNMDSFFALLEDQAPVAKIVLTTPPPSYLKRRVKAGSTRTKRGRRRVRYQTSYSYNANSAKAASLMVSYAKTAPRSYACYDLTTAFGSESEASKWLRQGWMHSDRVHYTQAGYRRLGQMIANTLVDQLRASTPRANS